MEQSTGKEYRPVRWALLAVLAAFLLGLPGLFAIPAERILFNPEAYKETLREQGVYERAPALFGELAAAGSSRLLPGSGSVLFDVLEGERYQTVARLLFPETWLREQSESLIDQFWAYFNFEQEQFRLLVDMRPVKEHLSGSGAPMVATIILDGLPPCSAEDLLNFAIQALTGQGGELPLCRPGEQFIGLANQLIGNLLRGSAAAMPDTVDLASGMRLARLLTGPQVEQGWARGFAVYRFFRQVGPYLPWTALVMAGLAALAGWGTRRGPLFWGGLAVALPAVSAVVVALLLGLWSEQFIPFLVLQAVGDGTALLDTLSDLIEEVNRRYLGEVMRIALVVAAAGGLMIVTSLVWKKTRSAEMPAE